MVRSDESGNPCRDDSGRWFRRRQALQQAWQVRQVWQVQQRQLLILRKSLLKSRRSGRSGGKEAKGEGGTCACRGLWSEDLPKARVRTFLIPPVFLLPASLASSSAQNGAPDQGGDWPWDCCRITRCMVFRVWMARRRKIRRGECAKPKNGPADTGKKRASTSTTDTAAPYICRLHSDRKEGIPRGQGVALTSLLAKGNNATVGQTRRDV